VYIQVYYYVDNEYVVIEDTGTISKRDCVKGHREYEHHECDWLIHIENGSSVSTYNIYRISVIFAVIVVSFKAFSQVWILQK